MTTADAHDPTPSYRDRIAILPGDPRIAYRPGKVVAGGRDAQRRLAELLLVGDDEAARDDRVPSLLSQLTDEQRENQIIDALVGDDGAREWFVAEAVDDAPAVVEQLTREGHMAHLDIVYFANGARCCGLCPPHPAIWGEFAANPYSANPYSANPYSANPYSANPYSANPFSANAETLNVAATGKPPMSSVMPARERAITSRPTHDDRANIVIGVLDSGLAQGSFRPKELGTHGAILDRISGGKDVPSADGDFYLDPVAGHGTFIAGIIEQLTPGCTITVRKVFEVDGDVSVAELFVALLVLVIEHDPKIVNLSFAGTSDGNTLFESLIRFLHRLTVTTDLVDIVFVASAGNEGTCVEQYPAALPEVIGVGALSPTGPAPWSNYGPWVDACAPGTDLVSAFFAEFDGAHPPINGVDPDNFEQWATWSGTSFAAPVVVAALARDMSTTPPISARPAVERVIRAPHLVRFPNMGTIVNY